jgi:hypothetical protein
MLYRHGLGGLFAVLLGLLSNNAAHADVVGAYTTSGATVNSALISGLNFPGGIAVSGSELFVTAAPSTVPEPSNLTLTLCGLVLAGLVAAGAVNASTNLLSRDSDQTVRGACHGCRTWMGSMPAMRSMRRMRCCMSAKLSLFQLRELNAPKQHHSDWYRSVAKRVPVDISAIAD